MFKKGDFIIGLKGAPYSITKYNVICYVYSVDMGSIMAGPINGGGSYPVNARYFKKYDVELL